MAMCFSNLFNYHIKLLLLYYYIITVTYIIILLLHYIWKFRHGNVFLKFLLKSSCALLSGTFTRPRKEEMNKKRRTVKARIVIDDASGIINISRCAPWSSGYGTVLLAWKQATSGFCRETCAIHAQAKGRGNTVSFFLLSLTAAQRPVTWETVASHPFAVDAHVTGVGQNRRLSTMISVKSRLLIVTNS